MFLKGKIDPLKLVRNAVFNPFLSYYMYLSSESLSSEIDVDKWAVSLWQMSLWTEKWKETFCWGTWAMGCLSDPARLTAASGEERGALESFLFQMLTILFFKWIVFPLTASLHCSGSVMLTNGPTVHLKDFIPSSVLFTRLWWGFISKLERFKHSGLLFWNSKLFHLFSLCV